MGEAKDDFLARLSPHKEKLYNFILKSANYSPDADDLFQDTVLKAFQYYSSYDKDKAFKPWIFRIASNTIRDYFRLRHPALPIERINIPDRTDRRTQQDIREIYRLAGRLKPKHKLVFFLYYYNDFSVSEISDVTGLSVFSVKFILSQSRKAVKRYLGGSE
jgi:RNA polymerase sigma-70 factor (ECF subfamily)